MNEEELQNIIETIKIMPRAYYRGERLIYSRDAIEKLVEAYQQEKEKNKQLEEENAKAIESEADIAVGSHKLINNLAQAIRFMSTNENLTVEDIIEEFSKENKVTEEFMERWEKVQLKESHLKDKVIDMMAEKLVRVPENDFMSETQLSVVHLINSNIEEKKEHIKEYYFNKVRGEKNE